MSFLEQWRVKAASLAGAVANLRLDILKERLAAGGAGRRWQQVVLAGSVVGVLGLLIWLSARSAASQFGERDFEIRLVCAACGHSFVSSRQEMIDASVAAQKKGFAGAGVSMTAPIGLCPKCGKLATYRARQCPKCGKPVAPPFAVVDGVRVVQKCRACGWSAQPK